MNAETGLRQGDVFLADHSDNWSQAFALEHRALNEALVGFDPNIEHVGSTAVPDLQAKPIIDIAIAVASIRAIPDVIPRMQKLGYIYCGDAGADGGHLFVRESSPNVRSHHVHVVAASDPQWHAYLRFRDCLRRDRVLREEYAQIKTRLSKEFPHDRPSYTAGKTVFIRRILQSET